MQRVVQGRSATLQHTFYENGVPTNPTPDSATVSITRDDGTVLVTDAATTDAGVGAVTYTLTPAQTALLDTLTVTWKATFGGQAQTFKETIEVAGGTLFTLAQARATAPLGDTAKYSDAKIIDARTMVESALEDACGVAFCPRYRREVVSGNGSTMLMLNPRLRKVRSVKLDDTVLDATTLATVKINPAGVMYYAAGFTSGFANVEIAYEHGFDHPPPRVTEAALLWTKIHLVQGPMDERTTRFTTEEGSYELSNLPPEVNAVIRSYSLHAGIA